MSDDNTSSVSTENFVQISYCERQHCWQEAGEERKRWDSGWKYFDVLPKNPLSHFFIAVNRYVINQVRLNRKGHFQEWGQRTSSSIYKVIIIELSGTHLGHHPARKEERDSLSLLYNHWWMNRMNSICVHFIDCGENLISAFKFLIHQYSSLKFHHRVRPCQHCLRVTHWLTVGFPTEAH